MRRPGDRQPIESAANPAQHDRRKAAAGSQTPVANQWPSGPLAVGAGAWSRAVKRGGRSVAIQRILEHALTQAMLANSSRNSTTSSAAGQAIARTGGRKSASGIGRCTRHRPWIGRHAEHIPGQ
jgi:hypothetical protein